MRHEPHQDAKADQNSNSPRQTSQLNAAIRCLCHRAAHCGSLGSNSEPCFCNPRLDGLNLSLNDLFIELWALHVSPDNRLRHRFVHTDQAEAAHSRVRR